MLRAHPRQPIADIGVLVCIDECYACAPSCTICADAQDTP
jgi:hypothetical protein